MTRTFTGAAALALILAGCVSVEVQRPPQRDTRGDATLAAIMSAAPKQCPAGRTRLNARTGGETQRVGFDQTEVSRVTLADGRTMVMQRNVIQPGGVIPWHDHGGRQGMGMVVSGQMTEYRNSCLDPMIYRAGDVVREERDTAHYWRNEGREEAVMLGFSVLTAQ